MSIAVPPEELAATAKDHGPSAFVLTVGDDRRARVLHVPVSIDVKGVIRTRVGRRTAQSALARPKVSVLWMPASDGYSLIADGIAELDGEPRPNTPLKISVSWAVKHRPAPM